MFADSVQVGPDPEDMRDQRAYHLVMNGDAAGFNALRAQYPEWQPSFYNREFVGISFAGFNWHGVNFCDARFYNVDFDGAVLDGVVGLTHQQIANLLSREGFFAL